MATQSKKLENAVDRASSNPPLAAALTQLVQLQVLLDVAPATQELETLRRVVLFAASAASSVEPDLIDSTMSEELRTRCVAAVNAIPYAETDPAQVTNAVDLLRQPARNLVSLAGSVTTKSNALVSSLLLAGEMQTGLSKALEQAEAEADALQTARLEKVAAWDEWKDSVDADFETFSSDWDAWKESGAEQYQVWLREREAEMEYERVSITKAGLEMSDQADSLLAKLRETLGLAADASLSVGYSHQADSEAELASDDKRKAVRFGVAAAIVAGIAVAMQYVAAANDWHLSQATVVPAKLAVIAALAAISRYFAVNATAHRNYAQQLRTTGLELNNVGNYLAELSSEERSEVRKQLVPTFFGQQPVAHTESAPIPSDSVGAAFTALAEMASRLPKP